MRCLVLSCSQTKKDDLEPLPAIERYKGPAFQVLRRFLAEADSKLHDVDIYILSARYGLIASDTLIENYDQKMTKDRATKLRCEVLKRLKGILRQDYVDIFCSLSKTYLQAMDGFEALVPADTRITVSRAALGTRLTELKNWLYQLSSDDLVTAQKQLSFVEMSEQPTHIMGRATLKGKQIEAKSDEIIALAQQALQDERGVSSDNFRSWYTLIDGQKVSIKWLVSLLSGLDVSAFDTADSRRILRQLGIATYRDA